MSQFLYASDIYRPLNLLSFVRAVPLSPKCRSCLAVLNPPTCLRSCAGACRAGKVTAPTAASACQAWGEGWCVRACVRACVRGCVGAWVGGWVGGCVQKRPSRATPSCLPRLACCVSEGFTTSPIATSCFSFNYLPQVADVCVCVFKGPVPSMLAAGRVPFV